MHNKQPKPHIQYGRLDNPSTSSQKATRFKKTIVLISGLLIFGIGMLASAYVYVRAKQKNDNAPLSTTTRDRIRYAFDGYIDADERSTLLASLRSYASTHNHDLVQAKDVSSADILITSSPIESDTHLSTPSTVQLSPISSATPLRSNAKTIGLRFRENMSDADKASLTSSFGPMYQTSKKTWTYLAIGDIIPARDVYTYSKRKGFLYPYAKVSDTLKSADLTVTNLETTIADGQANGEGVGMMVFTAPSQSFQGLITSGIDGVSLANNHAMNGGGSKVAEMLSGLDARQIGHFGVSTSAGVSTWTTTVDNIKITHLSFNTIPGSIDPTATSPGARRIALKPWGSLSDADVAFVQEQIKLAKQSADVVIPWFHWGTEYTHEANDEQRRLAHASIDAGAETVIGTHPHWTQGIEWYNDHFIAYSLGNFIFDQNWSDETRRSFAAELTFTGTRVTGVELKPAYIENWVQPRFLAPSETLYTQILTDISIHSWWR